MLSEIDIIHEDNSIIVLHKPPGTASETKRIGEADCVSFIKRHLGSPDSYCAMINRLDQPVEGIILFAKTKKAAEELSRQLRDGLMEKEYLALVYSDDRLPDAGEVRILTDHIVRDPRSNISRITDRNDKKGKRAELEYEVIERPQKNTALLKIHLLTGRHHQIRVQLSHAGLPVIGDRKYGYMPDNYKGQLCLAAVGLGFINPGNGNREEYRIDGQTIEMIFLKA